ncbi:hypothetical protein MYXO_00761 [Myxococcaceae bacterium]|nr:hypothetical protein MYXO_00761 [Myxococcaceae bacterium]
MSGSRSPGSPADALRALGHALRVTRPDAIGSQILAIVSDRLGDVVFCTPAFRLLRESAPRARIDVVVQSEAAGQVLRGNPCIDRVLRPDARSLRERATRYDVVLDFKDNRVSREITSRLGAPAVVALREGSGHEVERALSVVEHALGVTRGDAPRCYEIHPSREDDARAAELLAAAGVRPADVLLGCHAGCNRAARRGWRFWRTASHPKAWPLDRFVAFASGLADSRPEIRLVLTGSAGERDVARRLLRAAPRSIDLVGRTSVGELYCVLQRLRAFVTSDTGPLHVACAAGVPLVALFGATPVARFGPWPPQQDRRVLHAEPLSELSVEAVRDATLAAIENGRGERPA